MSRAKILLNKALNNNLVEQNWSINNNIPTNNISTRRRQFTFNFPDYGFSDSGKDV